MGCDLPKIHIEWDHAHADGLQPELCTYRKIVTRLGSHDGVETSLDTEYVDECVCERAPAEAPSGRTSVVSDEAENGGSVLHDVRAMCRSLGRLRELGATVMIDGREATTAALDAYEDTLAREVCQLGSDEALDKSGAYCHGTGKGVGLLSVIIYAVAFAVVLQWLFSCS